MDQFAAELEQTLQQILRPTSGDSIKESSDRLRKVFYKSPDAVLALIRLLQSHPEPQLRQLAGVEVRKLVSLYWTAPTNPYSKDTKNEIRQSLYQSTLGEQNDLVRHTSARVISSIARLDLDEDEWPTLLPALVETVQSSRASDREVAVYIIYTLVEYDQSEWMLEHSGELMRLLSNTLADPESLDVRASSVLALGRLAEILDIESSKQFSQVVPAIVEVLHQAIEANDDKAALQIFEVLTDLTLSEPVLLGNSFGHLVQLMLTKYAIPRDVDNEYRNASLKFLYSAIRYRCKKIQSLKLGPQLTQGAIEIIAQPLDEGDTGEDDDEDEDDEPYKLALRLVDLLSQSLPPSQVMQPLLEMFPQLLHSGDVYQARAAYLAISQAVEGAREFVSNIIETLLPAIVEGLKSDVTLVKVAALQALCMTSIELPLQVSQEHEVLLPLVFGIMDQATSLKVGRTACTALDSILEALDRDVITTKYLHVLVPKLLDLVDKIDDTELKGSVVTAIGSAAFAAGRNFMPYYERVITTLSKFIVVPDPTNPLEEPIQRLCATTMDTLGTLCRSVGKEAFAPYMPATMDAVTAFLATEEVSLRESAFVFLGTAAKVYGDALTSYLPSIMPRLFFTFDQQEFTFDDDLDGDVAVGANDEEEDLMDSLKINSAVAIEKEFACDCLVDLATSIPANDFAPYLEQTVSVLASLVEHIYEDVRRSAVFGIWRIVTACYLVDAGAVAEEWTPGFPFSGSLPERTTNLLVQAHAAMGELLLVENDRLVMASAFEAVSDAIRACGPVILGNEQSLQPLMEAVSEVISKVHRSQLEDELEEPVPDTDNIDGEDSSEADETLINTATDFLIQVCAAMGPQFLPIFPTVATMLGKYVQSKNSGNRLIGVGTLAELANMLKSAVTEYTESLLHVFVTALDDKKLQVRSLAAYGVGQLVYNSQNEELVRTIYPTILPKLQGLLKKVDKEERRRAKLSNSDEEDFNDQRSLANACGCVARMAERHPDSVPLDQVIPVLLKRLPLQDAYEENVPVFQLLVMLLQKEWPGIPENVPELLRVLEAVYAEQAAAEARDKDNVEGEDKGQSQLMFPEAQKAAKEVLTILEQRQPGLISSNPNLAPGLQ